MISVYQLKTKFQNLLRPISDFFATHGITANMVTIFAFILSCAVGAFIYFKAPQCSCAYWALPVILFVRMALNAIDGMIAREHNQKTPFGAILNELGDIVSDCVIYLPFLYVCHCNVWLIFAMILLTVISETVGIMGVQIGASRHYEGPMGKSDRAFWFGVFAIVLVFKQIQPSYIEIFTGIVSLLLVYTVFNRINGALKEVKAK